MQYDIAIVGAGPAGLAFARLLSDTGLRIALVEKLPEAELAEPPVDGRDIALTHQSLDILRKVGVWPLIPDECVSPIREARVLDGESPYTLNFDSDRESYDALGFLVANNVIRKAVYQAVAPLDRVDLIADTTVTQVSTDSDNGTLTLSDGRSLTATLVVAADNRFSTTRRMMGIAADMQDFGRVAIVCEMEHERSHDNVAFECFHYGRTLAILPMPGNTSSIVITVPTPMADAIVNMDEAAFNTDIQQRFGNRLGAMKLITERFPYPLVAVHAKRFIANRFALIGDAAVGMHPVTAHGYNLGLSGAEILAREVRNAQSKGGDIAAQTLLSRYQWQHMLTTRPLFHGTNQMVGLFTNDSLPATLLRKAMLRLSNNLPPIKWAIKSKLTARGGLPDRPLPTPPRLPSRSPGL